MPQFLFPTKPPITLIPPTNQTLVTPLGITTALDFIVTTNLALVGLSAVGGNVDGMVVLMSSIGTERVELTLVNEDNRALEEHRFRCPALASFTLSAGDAATFRYNGNIRRWFCIGSPRR